MCGLILVILALLIMRLIFIVPSRGIIIMNKSLVIITGAGSGIRLTFFTRILGQTSYALLKSSFEKIAIDF